MDTAYQSAPKLLSIYITAKNTMERSHTGLRSIWAKYVPW